MAETTTIALPEPELFKEQAIVWANHFRVFCLLDSNNYPHKNYSNKEWLLAIDAIEEISENKNAFDALKKFSKDKTVFGFLSYDLKNEIEKLESNHVDGLKFPLLYIFKPRYVFEITGNKLTVNRNYPETFELFEAISKQTVPQSENKIKHCLQPRTSQKKYLSNVKQIQQQIEEGDFYELNYCNEFFSENTELNPVETFLKLNSKSKAPFSSFFKLDEKFVCCASPERFLKKEGTKLISQPIKGTSRKGNTAEENILLQQQLAADEKERAENVMIVDLVRNDLARSSKAGTVMVEELCKVYEFETVQQMISTVVSEIDNEVHFVDCIKNCFPMGSMTGAPKIEVLKNIECYEDFKRGLYSGSIGYITADGNFDFNVVIRSIFYNAAEKYLSVRAGGAITYDSKAESEWEEILLKVKGMLEVLNAELASLSS
ncbi:MAG: anthranilate synthase component I family protein [Bacteroidetes bacterium]|nr:anthranilate synthase component I family protein [Bacteroidota bacterium]